MVVVVKKQKDNKKIKLIIVGLVLAGIFVWYYFHMQNVYKAQEEARLKQQQEKLLPKPNIPKQHTKHRVKGFGKYENIIYNEAKTIVELIGQEHIRQVRVVKDKLLIVTDPNASIESIKVRYGAMALIKESGDNKKIAIDLGVIVKK